MIDADLIKRVQDEVASSDTLFVVLPGGVVLFADDIKNKTNDELRAILEARLTERPQ